jgi:hypothetical protein
MASWASGRSARIMAGCMAVRSALGMSRGGRGGLLCSGAPLNLAGLRISQTEKEVKRPWWSAGAAGAGRWAEGGDASSSDFSRFDRDSTNFC